MSYFSRNTTQPLIKNNKEFMVHSHIISVQSEDRDVLKWPNSSQFEIELPIEYKNICAITVLDMQIPNTFYNFSTIDHNVGSHFNNSTGKFTVPTGFDGVYLITYFSGLKSAQNWFAGGIYTNSANFDLQFSHHPENQYHTGTPVITRSLVAGNEIAIGRGNNTVATNYGGNAYLGFGVTFLG